MVAVGLGVGASSATAEYRYDYGSGGSTSSPSPSPSPTTTTPAPTTTTTPAPTTTTAPLVGVGSCTKWWYVPTLRSEAGQQPSYRLTIVGNSGSTYSTKGSFRVYDNNHRLVRTIASTGSNTVVVSGSGMTATIAAASYVSVSYVNPDGRESAKVTCAKTYSPIALDTDRSGAIELGSDEVSIDIDGNGTQDRLSGWFAPGSSVLVSTDGLGDGVSGEDLFGDQGGRYADGFAKLATLDANGDQVVSGAELDGLGLWVDNGDAVFEASELASLASEDITSLSTQHDQFRSSATLANGDQILSEDIWFDLAQ